MSFLKLEIANFRKNFPYVLFFILNLPFASLDFILLQKKIDKPLHILRIGC